MRRLTLAGLLAAASFAVMAPSSEAVTLPGNNPNPCTTSTSTITTLPGIQLPAPIPCNYSSIPSVCLGQNNNTASVAFNPNQLILTSKCIIGILTGLNQPKAPV